MWTVTTNRRTGFQDAPGGPLSAIQLFRGLPPHALREMEKGAVEKNYAKGETLFMEDDPAEWVWFVKEGHVKLAHYSADGKSQTMALKGPGGMFGISALGGESYGLYAMAESDATAVSVPVPDFQRALGRHPGFARDVLGQLSRLLRQAKEMERISGVSAEKRLLHTLLEMAGEFGPEVPLTRREIAEMSGTAVETCIRVFTRLEGDRLISSSHGRIRVRDLEKLRGRMGKL